MSTHLVVFAKDPAPGAAKTRLAGRLTPQQAADLYRAFVQDIVAQVDRVPVDVRVLAFTGADPGSAGSLVTPSWRILTQADADLGGRMAAAADEQFRDGATQVIIIGTDAPSLPDCHLTRAAELLGTVDVVLGPSTDGGYYLVGLSRPLPVIFSDIDWSTNRVLHQTVDRIRTADLSLGLLPPWYDVDTPEDLDLLRGHLAAARCAGSDSLPAHTIAMIEALDARPASPTPGTRCSIPDGVGMGGIR